MFFFFFFRGHSRMANIYVSELQQRVTIGALKHTNLHRFFGSVTASF
jgi:hypothetical protein